MTVTDIFISVNNCNNHKKCKTIVDTTVTDKPSVSHRESPGLNPSKGEKHYILILNWTGSNLLVIIQGWWLFNRWTFSTNSRGIHIIILDCILNDWCYYLFCILFQEGVNALRPCKIKEFFFWGSSCVACQSQTSQPVLNKNNCNTHPVRVQLRDNSLVLCKHLFYKNRHILTEFG